MNETNAINQWSQRLGELLRQDPKKSGILGVLGLAFGILIVRAILLTSGGPSHAAAATTGARPPAGNPQMHSAHGSEDSHAMLFNVPTGATTASRVSTNQKLREWIGQPVPSVSRNLFAVKLEYFPRDGRTHVAGSDKNEDVEDGGDFWGKLEKSLLLQADQKEKRDNLQANYKAEAARLRLDSIMMGASPRAMIDGHLVTPGDSVSSFKVIQIEARRIVVERDGCTFEIAMK